MGIIIRNGISYSGVTNGSTGGTSDFNDLTNRPLFGDNVMTGDTNIPAIAQGLGIVFDQVGSLITVRSESYRIQRITSSDLVDNSINPDKIAQVLPTGYASLVSVMNGTTGLPPELTHRAFGMITRGGTTGGIYYMIVDIETGVIYTADTVSTDTSITWIAQKSWYELPAHPADYDVLQTTPFTYSDGNTITVTEGYIPFNYNDWVEYDYIDNSSNSYRALIQWEADNCLHLYTSVNNGEAEDILLTEEATDYGAETIPQTVTLGSVAGWKVAGAMGDRWGGLITVKGTPEKRMDFQRLFLLTQTVQNSNNDSLNVLFEATEGHDEDIAKLTEDVAGKLDKPFGGSNTVLDGYGTPIGFIGTTSFTAMAGDTTIPHLTSQLSDDVGYALQSELPTKVSDLQDDVGYALTSQLPTKVSDLPNDAAYITQATVPTTTSELQNDSNFAYTSQIPTTTSQLQNNSDFVVDANYVHTDNSLTQARIDTWNAKANAFTLKTVGNETLLGDGNIPLPEIPTTVSTFTNDAGYITQAQVPTTISSFSNDAGYIKIADVPDATSDLTNDSGFITSGDIPSNVSAFANDSGYLQGNVVRDVTLNGITVVSNNIAALVSPTPYTLPAATSSVRGGIVAGSGVVMTGDVLSVPAQPLPDRFSSSQNGSGTVGTVVSTYTIASLTAITPGATLSLADTVIFANGYQAEVTAISASTFTAITIFVPASGTTWGGITGTLSNQTDVNNAINGKLTVPTGTSAQYLDGTGSPTTFSLNASAITAGTLPVNRGGTGAGTFTAGSAIIGNGTSAFSAKAIDTAVTSGSSNLVTSGAVSTAITNNTPTWSSITGKPAVIAAGDDVTSARAAIGAGTSNLQIGSTSTTAMAGNKTAADLGGLQIGSTSTTAMAGNKTAADLGGIQIGTTASTAMAGNKTAADLGGLQIGTTGTTAMAGNTVIPTWSNISGKPAVVAAGADQAAARTSIGAGTSNLAIGSTSTTAMAGNKTAADLGGLQIGTTATTAMAGNTVIPTWSNISGKPAVVAGGADQAAARTSIGAGTSNLAIGTTSTTAMAGNKTAADLGGLQIGTTASTAMAGNTSIPRALTDLTGTTNLVFDANYNHTDNNLTTERINTWNGKADAFTLKTVGGTSLLGSGNVAFPTPTSTYSSVGTEAVNGVAVASAISTKQNTITTGTTSQYLRGDLSLATFPTIPTNTTQLTNGSGYVTSSGLTGVSAQTAASTTTLTLVQTVAASGANVTSTYKTLGGAGSVSVASSGSTITITGQSITQLLDTLGTVS